jgi:hypothetical protein
MPCACSGLTFGKKVGILISEAKVRTSSSELGTRCIETLRMFPEPQARCVPECSLSPLQNGSEDR